MEGVGRLNLWDCCIVFVWIKILSGVCGGTLKYFHKDGKYKKIWILCYRLSFAVFDRRLVFNVSYTRIDPNFLQEQPVSAEHLSNP